MTYPNFYLEGTCVTFTQEQCERLFKGKRPISWNWLRRRIKSQIPQLYDALSLDLCTFYKDALHLYAFRDGLLPSQGLIKTTAMFVHACKCRVFIPCAGFKKYFLRLGYSVFSGSMVNTTLYAHPTEDGAVLTDVPDEAYIHTYIDCGKNVKLFKAIAAINDATDYGQVFVSTSGWTLCPFNVFPVTPKTEGFRKATAEELIQRIDEICF